jgi:hypothetical protein
MICIKVVFRCFELKVGSEFRMEFHSLAHNTSREGMERWNSEERMSEPVSYDRYFRDLGFLRSVAEWAAQAGDWGVVHTIISTMRIAYEWANTAKGQRLDKTVGARQALLNMLGSRSIVFAYGSILYYQRDKLHRVNGPAKMLRIYRPPHEGASSLCVSWYHNGKLIRETEVQDAKTLHVWIPYSMLDQIERNRLHPTTMYGYMALQTLVAKHQLAKDEAKTYCASRAILERALPTIKTDDVYSSDSEEEAPASPVDANALFHDAYSELDRVNKERKKRRAAAAALPKKKKLRKREADTPENSE